MDEFFEDDLLLLLLLRRRRKRRALRRAVKRAKHKFWVRNIFRKLEQLGEFHRLVQELLYHTGQGKVSLSLQAFLPLLNLIESPFFFFSLTCSYFFSQYDIFRFFTNILLHI